MTAKFEIWLIAKSVPESVTVCIPPPTITLFTDVRLLLIILIVLLEGVMFIFVPAAFPPAKVH